MKAARKDLAIAHRIWAALSRRTGTPDPGEKGLRAADARTLRRAQLTLHRWAEEEANGTIERDQWSRIPQRRPKGDVERLAGRPIPDREAGALRRVAEVCKAAGLYWYYQRDPRGCALYVSAQPLNDTNYTSGIACAV